MLPSCRHGLGLASDWKMTFEAGKRHGFAWHGRAVPNQEALFQIKMTASRQAMPIDAPDGPNRRAAGKREGRDRGWSRLSLKHCN
jgi:hypothetical protein